MFGMKGPEAGTNSAPGDWCGMRYVIDDDKESSGFEFAALLLVIAASAIAFFVVSGDTGKQVAVVRFIEPVKAGPPASDEITGALAPATLPGHAPLPTHRPS